MLKKLFVALASVTAVLAAPAADQITNLPGAPTNIPFKQYAGYLTVNSTTNRNIFYWFVESTNNPATDPVVLWTNGGPGCSGLIGFLTEQGPFRPQQNLTLAYNEYAWNKIANMMFIESPAPVGFAYSDKESDYVTGDTQTAQDNYNGILQFLKKFPEYSSNPFFITSESYGGHYMPTLSKAIVQGNVAGVNPKINFKGMAVGNPFTDPISNNYGTFASFYGHSLVDKVTYDSWAASCFGTVVRPAHCVEAEIKMETEIGNVNPYALDYPVCLDSKAAPGRMQRAWFMRHTLPKERLEAMGLGSTYNYEPCTEDYMTQYLNQKDVQFAIHAQYKVWTECSYTLKYNTSDSQNPMEPVYQWLLANSDIKIMVYSGDDDSVCSTQGTQYWIWDLGYPVSQAWASWTDTNGQVGGYLTKFANSTGRGYTFATVRAAGHEVPAYTPQRALTVFSNFLSGKW